MAQSTSAAVQGSSSGFSKAQQTSILANYELETSTRRAQMESRMNSLLGQLSRRLENELARLPASLHDMSVGEFVETHQCNVRTALQAMVRQRQQTSQEARADGTSTPGSDLEKRVKEQQQQHTARKRKRTEQPSPHIGTQPPPSPALPKAKRHQADPLTSNVSKPSTKTPKAQKSQTFFQEKEPALNPRLPPTPRLPNGQLAYPPQLSIGGTTVVRKPRRNESIQLYSMNGSPLGVMPEGVADSAEEGGVPTGDFTFQMTLENLTRDLKRELGSANMTAAERERLEGRLLSLVDKLGSRS